MCEFGRLATALILLAFEYDRCIVLVRRDTCGRHVRLRFRVTGLLFLVYGMSYASINLIVA